MSTDGAFAKGRERFISRSSLSLRVGDFALLALGTCEAVMLGLVSRFFWDAKRPCAGSPVEGLTRAQGLWMSFLSMSGEDKEKV